MGYGDGRKPPYGRRKITEPSNIDFAELRCSGYFIPASRLSGFRNLSFDYRDTQQDAAHLYLRLITNQFERAMAAARGPTYKIMNE